MSLSSYLASKYLNAEPSSSTKSSGKKRKRKTKESNAGLIIADDDTLGWENSHKSDEEDDGRPVFVGEGRSAEFRKAKKSAWTTVGSAAPRDSEQIAADAILAGVVRENAARGEGDDAPVIEDDMEGVVKMESGAHAGLQTAAAVTAQFERRKREERRRFEEEERAGKVKSTANGEETVYRDATGRRIDLQMRRADKRKEADEAERRLREEEELQRGDVQIAERAKRREALEEAKFMPLARTRDDEEMNRELKEIDRWNDPAAQFVKKKTAGKSASGRPLYTGAAAPNRYGIRPGYRWDGVDRGNGWEGERFKALNRKMRNKELDFAWQMDE